MECEFGLRGTYLLIRDPVLVFVNVSEVQCIATIQHAMKWALYPLLSVYSTLQKLSEYTSLSSSMMLSPVKVLDLDLLLLARIDR